MGEQIPICLDGETIADSRVMDEQRETIADSRAPRAQRKPAWMTDYEAGKDVATLYMEEPIGENKIFRMLNFASGSLSKSYLVTTMQGGLLNGWVFCINYRRFI
ncbi:hypothetical protein H5410_030471 [Solanum commersonii]|uniref:Uncharacterized protein n=1 Tax=Solanum commersonii TaxID=4109 RepID=A0A9J5YG94_SOLCO|nr:hypothetical protein H5410_030471 [Solanum commersonii]